MSSRGHTARKTHAQQDHEESQQGQKEREPIKRRKKELGLHYNKGAL